MLIVGLGSYENRHFKATDIMHHRWQRSADILTFSLHNAQQFGRRTGWLLHFDTRNQTDGKQSLNYIAWSEREQ